ncbi:MAG: serine/threonine-protein kinase [Almyronema sp.]
MDSLPKRSQYRLLGLVGQGQFGQVYCAVHRRTGHLVALKNLNRDRLPTHKFLRELRFLLSLKHPNIAACHALVHTRTGRQLVLDYCEGGTLRTLVESAKQLSQVEALQLMLDILSGLEQAHQQGIIHCDIKPENILLRITPGSWQALISDFGIARLNQELVVGWSNTGSPAYMAPERFYNQYSKASDLYSVGIILYELLVGCRPFSGTPVELMKAHLNQPPHIPTDLPLALQQILAKALQKLPMRRFQGAADMQEAILSAIAAGSQQYRLNGLLPAPFAATNTAALPQRSTSLAFWPEPTPHRDPKGWILSGGTLGLQPHRLPAAAEPTHLASEMMTLPDEVQAIEPTSRGLGIVTRQQIYWLDQFQGFDQSLQPRAIASFAQPCYGAFAQSGRWFAAATPATAQQGRGRLLIAQTVSVAPKAVPAQRELTHEIERIIALVPLDNHHFALIADSAAQASTYFHLYTRKGTYLGQLRLRTRLQQVKRTLVPYRLIAFEYSDPPTFLIIELKPFRVLRKRVAIAPKVAIATDWGYLIADQQGQLLFWDREVELIGAVQCPNPPTALLSLSAHEVSLATWDGQKAWLHYLDLRQLDLALIF